MSKNPAMGRKLRVGLLMDSTALPAWSFRAVEDIVRFDYAEIVLVILNDRKAEKSGFLSRLRRNWKNQLYLSFRHFEDRWVKIRPDAQERKDVSSLLAGVPVIKIRPLQKKFSDSFSDEDLGRIRPYEVDILVRWGFRILRGEILNLPKFGIWSYHLGDNDTLRGGPAGVWDVIENRTVSGAVLQILTEDLDNGLILQRSFTATEAFSIKRNRNSLYWDNSSHLTYKLRQLHRLGEEAFFREVRNANREPRFYSRRLYTAPTNGLFLKFLLRLAWRTIRRHVRNGLFRKQWFLLFNREEGFSTSLWRFKKLLPPPDRSWADPFIISRDGHWHVYLEEYSLAKRRGHIAHMSLDPNGQWSFPRPVIERPCHLSYPFILEHEGQAFMVLTNGIARSVELYRCASFPDQWTFERTLLNNVEAFDATLVRHEESWWMFVNIKEHPGGSSWTSLFIFHSADLLRGEWTPHPKNPVVTDVRRARLAGQIFPRNGALYRPAQDSSQGYGCGIRIHRIDVLTEEDFQETEVAPITPSWDRKIRGVHTINHVAGLTLVDAKRYIFKFFR